MELRDPVGVAAGDLLAVGALDRGGGRAGGQPQERRGLGQAAGAVGVVGAGQDALAARLPYRGGDPFVVRRDDDPGERTGPPHALEHVNDER